MESLFAALGLVFVAELGDKTQLVALGFGARHRFAPVLTGVVLAYSLTNLLSVLLGTAVGAALPERAIGVGGGLLFLGFAVWTLRSSADEDEDEDEDELAEGLSSRRSVVLTVAAAMFVAELGDKTMLATATLAARGHPVFVWIGATLGIVASGGLGVALGRAVGTKLSRRAVRHVSAALFAGFGIALIALSV